MPPLLPEITDHSTVDAAQEIQDVFAANGIPTAFFTDVLSLTQKYGPELLTAMLGFVSIYLINKGSSRYGELTNTENEHDRLSIIRDASQNIAIGAAGMSAIAFAAGNPLFAYPEVAALIGSLKPYLASRYPTVEKACERYPIGATVKTIAVGVGVGVIATHVRQPLEALAPLGLTSLTLAFSGMRQEFYRVLTVSGGSALCVGSLNAIHQSVQELNTVGALMGAAFLTLNFLFTRNEINEARKIGGIQKVVETACSTMMATLKKLFEISP